MTAPIALDRSTAPDQATGTARTPTGADAPEGLFASLLGGILPGAENGAEGGAEDTGEAQPETEAATVPMPTPLVPLIVSETSPKGQTPAAAAETLAPARAAKTLALLPPSGMQAKGLSNRVVAGAGEGTAATDLPATAEAVPAIPQRPAAALLPEGIADAAERPAAPLPADAVAESLGADDAAMPGTAIPEDTLASPDTPAAGDGPATAPGAKPADAPQPGPDMTAETPLAAPPETVSEMTPEMAADTAQGMASDAPAPQLAPQSAAPAAPATPPEARAVSAPLDTTRADWPADLRDMIDGIALTGEQDLEMTLAPETLGRLHIRLELRDGATTVSIVTETQEAARLLADSQHRLADLFARSGLELAGQNVSTGQGQGQGQDSARAARTLPQGAPAGDPAHDPAPDPARRGAAPSGRIDLMA